MAKVQGNGLSLTFGTSGWNPAITSFARTESTDDVETTDLSTPSARTYVGGAILEPGTYTFGFQYDPTISTRPTTGVSEAITVTYPISVAGNTAADDQFTGYVNSYDIETEINTLITGTFVLKVSGPVAETFEV
jgi:predicted porin